MQNNKGVFYAVLVIALVSFLHSCYYDDVLPKLVVIDENQPVSFTRDLVPVFQQSCALSGCHVPGEQKPDLTPGTAYNALVAGNFVNTQDPAVSELYLWVSGKKSQPMPLSGVDPKIAALVLAWIQQGSQNN